MTALKVGVVVMALLLTGGFALLGVTWWQSRAPEGHVVVDESAPWRGSLELPTGSRVNQLNSTSRTLEAVVTLPSGEQMIAVIRRKDGQLLGTMHLSSDRLGGGS